MTFQMSRMQQTTIDVQCEIRLAGPEHIDDIFGMVQRHRHVYQPTLGEIQLYQKDPGIMAAFDNDSLVAFELIVPAIYLEDAKIFSGIRKFIQKQTNKSGRLFILADNIIQREYRQRQITQNIHEKFKSHLDSITKGSIYTSESENFHAGHEYLARLGFQSIGSFHTTKGQRTVFKQDIGSL